MFSLLNIIAIKQKTQNIQQFAHDQMRSNEILLPASNKGISFKTDLIPEIHDFIKK